VILVVDFVVGIVAVVVYGVVLAVVCYFGVGVMYVGCDGSALLLLLVLVVGVLALYLRTLLVMWLLLVALLFVLALDVLPMMMLCC